MISIALVPFKFPAVFVAKWVLYVVNKSHFVYVRFSLFCLGIMGNRVTKHRSSVKRINTKSAEDSTRFRQGRPRKPWKFEAQSRTIQSVIIYTYFSWFMYFAIQKLFESVFLFFTIAYTTLNIFYFHRSINENIVLVSRAFRRQFVIPEFEEFTDKIEKFYFKCKEIDTGKV